MKYLLTILIGMYFDVAEPVWRIEVSSESMIARIVDAKLAVY